MSLLAPLVAARAAGFGLGLVRLPVPASEGGWRPATATGRDPALLARATAATGTPSRAVAATWQLEKHAWYTAATALAAVLVHGALPPLDDVLLRDGGDGLPCAIAAGEAGWTPAGAHELALRLDAHLAPIVGALAAHRPSRALWRCCGDRLGQAALWCGEAFDDGDAAWALAVDALTAPTRLQAPATLVWHAGRPLRRRSGCCLTLRCPGGESCADCPVTTGPCGPP